ncbi:MAG: glycerol-3-phosphate 1-O-acyltransferase PlsY [Alcanivorax sp.]
MDGNFVDIYCNISSPLGHAPFSTLSISIIHSSILLIVGYICGSIPFGLILTKTLIKKDIRTIGSGNIGATNVLRTGNKKLALATLFLDAFKGIIPIILLTPMVISPEAISHECVPKDSYVVISTLIALGAILGHCFPIWLKFKGGKGVATGIGVLLVAVPYAGLAACAAWIATAKITKYSSLSALIAFLIAPIVTLFIYGASPAAICALITLLIWVRHKDNIKRLLKGEESKIGQKNKPHPEEDASEPVSK